MTTTIEVGERAGAGARPWRTEAERVLRVAAGGLLGGLVSGFLVAGVGGRIAMRVVALQSPDGYQGLTTDDGAATGEITLSGSAGLIVFLTLVGAVGGLVYAATRSALPASRRPLVTAVVTGTAVGSIVIHADGVDYAVLGSRWVSVAMFAAIAAGYGALLSVVAERVLRPDGLVRRARPSRLAPLVVVLLPGLVIVPIGLVLAGVVALRATGLAARIPRLPVVVVARVGLALLVVATTLDLVRTLGDLA